MWLIYNLIQKSDQIRTSTYRKVVTERSTGASEAQKVKLTLTLSVERVEYDLDSNIVKVKGKNIEENKYVRKGQYHTFDLELNKKFYLSKSIWDSLALTQLHNAQDAGRNADVAVVIMQEGLAFVCLLTTNLTIQRAKIEVNIPRKRKNFCSQHEKGLENFFDQILQAIVRKIDLDKIKCVIVASPGFTRDQFGEYMWSQANGKTAAYRTLLDNKSKFLFAHSSTGFKHSIREILSDPDVQVKLEDTKACQEVRMWNIFQDLLGSKPERAAYGLRDVGLANHHKAISCLMLSESQFRSKNLALRKKLSSLMYEAQKYGAEVKIFSSMHITGQQLDQLTGIAAILKFEVPQLTSNICGKRQQYRCDINGERVDENVHDSDWSSDSCDSGSDTREEL